MKYVIDKSQPFKGYVITSLNDEGKDFEGHTIDELRKLKNNPALEVIDDAELTELVNEHRRKLNREPFREISKEEYDRLYDCLPPARSGMGWFFVGECSQYDLYPFCFEVGGKFFMGDRVISTPNNVLVKMINDYWKEYKLKEKAV